jgi:hypothetical protein
LTDCKAFCVGCWRTLEEIKGWRHYNEAEKQSVLDMIENRKKHYTIKEKQ